MQGNIAIIGGTGFEQLPPDIFVEEVQVSTHYGDVRALSISDNYTEPYKLYFLSRHGAEHGLAPHQINYAANIAALVELQVTDVFATNAVGSLRMDLSPGSLAVLDDFIDFTRQRGLTYLPASGRWQHTDFSVPYSPRLRAAIITAAKDLELALTERATYLCCDGPRFETPAEIRLFASWGADVVGMTGIPEAVFAREAGLRYAALAIVTNYGAGLTADPVDHVEVTRAMQTQIGTVRELLLRAAHRLIAEVFNTNPGDDLP
jgi:5'-methylthioadenosine phosphorylase